MRNSKQLEKALKCIYAYRDYLIRNEHIDKNIFKSFRLDQLAGFIYGVNYCLGSFDDIDDSLKLINDFPVNIKCCYHNHLNKLVNNIVE